MSVPIVRILIVRMRVVPARVASQVRIVEFPPMTG
jgi:hypothetical protein